MLDVDEAHRLRTPLTAIRLHGEQLLATTADPALRESAAAVVRLVDRMSAMIEEMLDGGDEPQGDANDA